MANSLKVVVDFVGDYGFCIVFSNRYFLFRGEKNMGF